jgi:hypothetical protein
MSQPAGHPPAGPGPIARLRREIVEKLLAEADFIAVVVSPLCPGVKLPEEYLRAGEPVPLHLGWRLPLPIPDLVLDERGISGTLSFRRTPFACHLPWESILQVSLGDEHLVWITAGPPPAPAEPPPEEQRRPKLRLV